MGLGWFMNVLGWSLLAWNRVGAPSNWTWTRDVVRGGKRSVPKFAMAFETGGKQVGLCKIGRSMQAQGDVPAPGLFVSGRLPSWAI